MEISRKWRVASLAAVALLVAGIQATFGTVADAATTATKLACGDRAKPFAAFPNVSVLCSDTTMYVSSNGIPDHQMMVGITGWNQQVPLPLLLTESLNQMWRFPLQPKAAVAEIATTGVGGTGIMLNGISIFNATKPAPNAQGSIYTPSADPKLAGELDTCAGHSGRGDDYHYHAEPECLIKELGNESALIGYMLDGYPIYGQAESNGVTATNLDKCNGHSDDVRGYHYHYTKSAPYSPMCFHGEVPSDISTTGQPNAGPARPAGEPAKVLITDLNFSLTATSTLKYTYNGVSGSVSWTPTTTGCWNFVYVNPPPGSPTTSNACRNIRTTPQVQGNSNPAPNSSNKPQVANPPTNTQKSQSASILPPTLAVNSQIETTCIQGKKVQKVVNSQCPKGFTAQSKRTISSSMQLKSSSFTFANNVYSLPTKFTCDGSKVSPAFEWNGVPVGTKSFALVMATVPGPPRPGESEANVSYSWLIYDIPAKSTKLVENVSGIGRMSATSHGPAGYAAPCSQGPGLKNYTFTLYALNSQLNSTFPSAESALSAMKGHVLGVASITAGYSRGA